MILTIDLQSDIPIYIQIRNKIITGIANGKLAPGDSLPSVRQLASDLGINLHTVNKVYTLLRQEGFLTIHRKSGVVVNDPEHFKENEIYRSKLQEELRPLLAESICRGVSQEDFIQHCYKVYSDILNKGGENE